MTQRAAFSSRLVAILSMIGVAVGLGNVWRFPYMAGRYGGSAFVLLYLFFALAFGAPALVAEAALGRLTRSGPVGALGKLFGAGGRWLGWLLVATLTIASSYYSAVIANVLYSLLFGLWRGYRPDTLSDYGIGLSRGAWQAGCGLVVVAAAGWVTARGLRRGIEMASRVLVPLFGVIVALLVVAALRLPGALGALARFARPDFAALDGRSVFAAMGQAFFSLSLGGTFYVTYGSYLSERQRLVPTSVATALGDLGAALLAALFVLPATLALGLDMASGPGLVFATLPRLFSEIAFGTVLAVAFFLALLIVAFLSVVAAFEVVVDALEQRGALRPHAALGLTLAVSILLLPSSFRPEIIGVLDLLFGSGMQCLGSAIAVMALAWAVDRKVALREAFGRPGEDFRPAARHLLFLGWIRFVVPAALLLTLALFIADSLSG